MAQASKLTDLQLVLLTTASQRPDSSLLPAPDSIAEARGRIRIAITALLKRSLVEEAPATGGAGSWREDGDAQIGAFISNSGRTAIGLVSPPSTEPVEAEAKVASTPREGSKQAAVVSLLQRPDGASLADLVGATGWLPHTTRAALTGLRKRGHVIAGDKASGTTRYRIGG